MTNTAELKVEYIPITELVPYAKNAKLHPEEQVEQIKASIRDFGMNDPIAIWKNNEIIEGHGRLAACRELGIEKVPVIRLDSLTDEERRAYMLAHNQTTMNTGWDINLLEEELQALMDEEIDMSQFGFDISDDDTEEIKEDDFDDTLPEVPTSKVGQIWKCGRHRLIIGDSTDPEVIKKLMQGEKADILMTDPPYNCSVGDCERPNSSNNGVHIMNDKMPEKVFIEFLTKALKNAASSMRGGSCFYIWYAGLHHIEFETSVRNVPDFRLHEQLVWIKSHFVLGRNSDYQWAHEPCLYGWKKGEKHYFTDSRAEATIIEDPMCKLSTMKKGELIDLCEKLLHQDKASTVLRADKPSSADLHPTVKPQHLICRLLRNSSQKDWLVLDLFGGSGTTMIAAEQTGRVCYMAELDPKYADVILKRFEEFTGQAPQLIEDAKTE